MQILIAIAVVFLLFCVFQIRNALWSLRKIAVLRLALEVDRETTLKTTSIDERISYISKWAIKKGGERSYGESEESRSRFLIELVRLVRLF